MPLDAPIRPPLKVLDLPRVAAPPPAPSLVSSGGGRRSLGSGGGSDIATQRVQIAQSAQDLREQRFDHRSEMDEAKLSLDQQKQLLDRAKLTEKLLLSRAKVQKDYNATMSGNAAIEAMTQLDPTDPKFRKQWTDIAAKYSDGITTPAARAITGQIFQQYQDHKAAEKERALATYTDPDASAVYEKSLPNGEHFAAAQANATLALKKQAMAVLSDPNAAAFHAKIFNPQTGAWNLDPTVITQGTVAGAQAKALQQQAGSPTAALTSINAALKALPATTAGEPKLITDTRYNLQQAMKDKSFQLANPGKPGSVIEAGAAPASAGDAELADLFGNKAPAAPAAAAAAPSAATAPAPFIATPEIPGGDELGDDEKAEPTPDDENAE